jgi:hypothetical protein
MSITMEAQAAPLRTWALTGLAVLGICAVLLAGCDPEPAPPEAGPSTAGCADAGPRTRDFLPQFPAGTRAVVNPCLGLGDLGDVIDLIPAGDRAKIGPFVKGIAGLARKVLTFDSLAECGYRTDRLALGLYQDRGTRWSVGVVAVTRGRVDAVKDTAKCFLLDQVPFLPGAASPVSSGPAQPQPAFCVDTVHRSRGGQEYTVLWLGSSDTMCGDLGAQLTAGAEAGDGLTATVKASPDVTVRAGASTKAREIRRAPAGQVVVVGCYRVGEKVDGRRGASDRWYRLLDEDGEQYIAGAWLDTGDRADRPGRCR